MKAASESKHKLADEIVGRLARRHSTAVVLFHHVVAERLGLGPTDHKCLDLLRERGAMAGSDLGAITGLTVIDPLRRDVAALLQNFDTHQLTAVADFLARTTDLIYRHAALLRAETISDVRPTRTTGRASSSNNAQ